jgi:hypothetical protein
MVGETGCPMSALNTAALLETFRFGDFVVVAPIAWYTDAIPMRFEVSVMDENLASEPQWWFNLIRQISIRKS